MRSVNKPYISLLGLVFLNMFSKAAHRLGQADHVDDGPMTDDKIGKNKIPSMIVGFPWDVLMNRNRILTSGFLEEENKKYLFLLDGR